MATVSTRPEIPVRSPAEILAWSENLAGGNPPERPILAPWCPAGGLCAVIGLSQDPERELDMTALSRDGVGLIRRQSGGGAVLLGPGTVCWEAVASLAWLESAGGAGIRNAYAVLSRPVAKALRLLGAEVSPDGVSDLSAPAGAEGEPARKVAGTAQLRKRRTVLVHGSLLLAADVSLFSRYLRMPSDQPAYRAGRGHADFCLSVADWLELDAAERDALPGRFAETLAAILDQDGWNRLSPPDNLSPEGLALLHGKYLSDDWNRRRKRTAEPRRGPFRI